MLNPRSLYAAFGLAVFLVAASAYGASRVTVEPAADSTDGGPGVSIVVYDGTSSPATVVAGCSEPTCMGWEGPVSGTVTHEKNYVGHMVTGGDSRSRLYLYVDGQYATSARPGRMLIFSTSNLVAGPHVLEAMAYDTQKNEGWSTPLTITVVK